MGDRARREGTGAGLALLEVVEVAAGLPCNWERGPQGGFQEGWKGVETSWGFVFCVEWLGFSSSFCPGLQ